MNLVEATVDGDAMRFGQFRVPARRRPRRRPASASCSASGRRASRTRRSRPGLPTIDVAGRGGRGARLRRPRLLPRRRAADHRGGARIGCQRRDSCRTTGRSSPPGSTPATAARSATTVELAVDAARFHFFDPDTGARLSRRPARRARRRRVVTKQRETRERVLELIEALGVGDAIPSERQLGIDLGVSRLTVRAALDELVREGYLVRRRGAGTFVAEPKVAKGIDITLVQRRHARPRADAGKPHARAARRSRPARASAASCTSRRPSRSSRSSAFASPTASRWRSSCCTSARRSCPGLTGARPRGALVLRPAREPLRRRDRRRHADGRADGHERGGVGRARRAAPLAGAALRARHARRDRRRGRVHELDLPRRPLPARDRDRRSAAGRARSRLRISSELRPVGEIGIDISVNDCESIRPNGKWSVPTVRRRDSQ